MFTLKRHIFDTFSHSKEKTDADDCITVADDGDGGVVVVAFAFFYQIRLKFLLFRCFFCSLYHDRFEKAMNSKNFFHF